MPAPTEAITTGQLLLIAVNILLTITGFVIALMIKRLYVSVDALAKKDNAIEAMVTKHREDVLQNYSKSTSLAELKDDVFKRFDRFEDNVMKAIRNIN